MYSISRSHNASVFLILVFILSIFLDLIMIFSFSILILLEWEEEVEEADFTEKASLNLLKLNFCIDPQKEKRPENIIL